MTPLRRRMTEDMENGNLMKMGTCAFRVRI